MGLKQTIADMLNNEPTGTIRPEGLMQFGGVGSQRMQQQPEYQEMMN
jgi:hypothetical protein